MNNSMSNETSFFPQGAHIQWETKQVKSWLMRRQQKTSSPASPAPTSSSDPLVCPLSQDTPAFCPPNVSSIFPEPAPTPKRTTHQSLPGPCSLPSPLPLNPWHPWLDQSHRRGHALPCTTGCPGLKQANLLH